MSLTVKMQMQFLLTNKIGEDCHSVVKEILDKYAAMRFAFDLFKKMRQVNHQLSWLLYFRVKYPLYGMDKIIDIVEESNNLVNLTNINSLIVCYRVFWFEGEPDEYESYEKWHKILDLMDFDEEQRRRCEQPWSLFENNEYCDEFSEKIDEYYDKYDWDMKTNRVSDLWQTYTEVTGLPNMDYRARMGLQSDNGTSV